MFVTWARIEYLSQVTRAMIEAYLIHVRQELKQGGKSVKDKFEAIRQFLDWCVSCEFLSSSPARGIRIKNPGRMPVQIRTATEVKKMIANADPVRAAILGLAAYAGMHTSEICDLLWADIDFSTRWIYIYNRGDDQETKTSVNRRTPILDQLLPLLTRLKRPKDGKGRVFASFASHSDTYSDVGPLRVLRHVAITSWLRSGASSGTAAEWAGNSPQIIERNYRARHCPEPIKFTFDGRPIPSHGELQIEKKTTSKAR